MATTAAASLCLYRKLESAMGTREAIALRRKINSMHGYALQDTDGDFKIIQKGRLAEGFRHKTSKEETVLIDNKTVVVSSIHDQFLNPRNNSVLLMRRDECPPGFVILEVLNRPNSALLRECQIQYYDKCVLSSLEYTYQCKSIFPDKVGIGCDSDFSILLECRNLPSECNGFIRRLRQHSWPSQNVIDKITRKGCYLNPTGSSSDLSFIHWRLTFIQAETYLVQSLNYVQLLVHFLLGIFHDDVIRKEASLGDVLCLYVLKTVLFYTVEETPSSLWRKENLLQCFCLCIGKLIEWVEKGFCPNFFIPEYNLFQRTHFEDRQKPLLTVLRSYQTTEWKTFLECPELKLMEIPKDFENGSNSERDFEQDREHQLDEIVFVKNSGILGSFPNPSDLEMTLVRSIILLLHSRSDQELHISETFIQNILGSQAPMCIMEQEQNERNKRTYALKRKCELMLKVFASGDLSAGALTLATYYHYVSNYDKAIQICDRILSDIKPPTLYANVEDKLWTLPKCYKTFVCGRNLPMAVKTKKYLLLDVYIWPLFKFMYPKELHPDIDTLQGSGCIPPVTYAVFILFLCHHSLGNIDQCLSLVHDLNTLVRDKEQGIYPIVLNLLGICLEKLGDMAGAVDAYCRSVEMRKEINGAHVLLQRILQ